MIYNTGKIQDGKKCEDLVAKFKQHMGNIRKRKHYEERNFFKIMKSYQNDFLEKLEEMTKPVSQMTIKFSDIISFFQKIIDQNEFEEFESNRRLNKDNRGHESQLLADFVDKIPKKIKVDDETSNPDIFSDNDLDYYDDSTRISIHHSKIFEIREPISLDEPVALSDQNGIIPNSDFLRNKNTEDFQNQHARQNPFEVFYNSEDEAEDEEDIFKGIIVI